MSLMTLDEAIQHCRDKENCSQCGQEHKQLREWLEELKDLRTRYNIPTPHGRLIDADELMKVIEENDYTLSSRLNTIDRGMFTIGIKQAIDEAPTIIEAEE